MIKLRPEELTGSVFERVGQQWMLITTAKEGKINTMTASWGGFGILWNKPVAFVFVRPQRYTFELIDNSGTFTLSFLPEEYRAAHNICGSKSGRDMDKIAEAGLTVSYFDSYPVIGQAELVIGCNKLYSQFLTDGGFTDRGIIPQCYPAGDFHKMYVGEIMAVGKTPGASA